MRRSLSYLALGYLPALLIGGLAVVARDVQVWHAALAVFVGGPILTLLVAALHSAPELRRRLMLRRRREREEQAPPEAAEPRGNSR